MVKKLMYVQWKDHYGRDESGWTHYTPDHVPEPILVSSVGWIVYETKELITVAPHVFGQADGTTSGAGEINILKCCIIKKKTIKI